MMHCLALVQLKKAHSDTTEQEGPMTADRLPQLLCELILSLHQWCRRCCLKLFLNSSSFSPFPSTENTICSILAEGNMRNIYVKLF